jgi:hypothetical protein
MCHVVLGWWHQVSSEAGTFATNFWFRSPLHAVLGRSRSSAALMAPYVARSALHSMLGAQLKQACHTRAMAAAGEAAGEAGGGTAGGLPPRPWSFSVADFSHPEALFHQSALLVTPLPLLLPLPLPADSRCDAPAPVHPQQQQQQQEQEQLQCLQTICEYFASASLEDMQAYWVTFARQVSSLKLYIAAAVAISVAAAIAHVTLSESKGLNNG